MKSKTEVNTKETAVGFDEEETVAVCYSENAVKEYVALGKELINIWAIPKNIYECNNLSDLKDVSSKWTKAQREEFIRFIKNYKSILKFSVDNIDDLVSVTDPKSLAVVNRLFEMMTFSRYRIMGHEIDSLDLPDNMMAFSVDVESDGKDITYKI